jgi:hypothetical protein
MDNSRLNQKSKERKTGQIIRIVFCKTFFLKVANHFSIKLQLHFPESCKIDFPAVEYRNQTFFPIVV